MEAKPSQRFRICIVSDFFYPRLGGVELHQYQLAQGLLSRGHKVIVVSLNLRNRRNCCNVYCMWWSFFHHKYSAVYIKITGTYGKKNERQGIRYMTNGLKVYYCPQMSIHNQASLPVLFTFFPVFRQIVLREQIQIVHGHQTTSSLAHECESP